MIRLPERSPIEFGFAPTLRDGAGDCCDDFRVHEVRRADHA